MRIADRRIEEVYQARYRGYCSALATVTGDYELARDVVQDAFAVALARRDQFRGGSLEAWIWRIAFRRALDARRRTRERVYNELGDVLDPALVEPERDPALAEAIKELPPRRRLIVFLRYFADLTYPEIAEACDVTEGTVAATLAQAHSNLAATLASEG